MHRDRLSPRWVTVVVVLALLASAGVALAIVLVTTGSDTAADNDPVPATTAPSTVAAPGPPSTPSAGGPTVAGGTVTGGTGADEPRTAGPATSPASTVLLPGSGLALPAAWRGTADLTIRVLGACSGAGGTSSYRTPADLAIDVAKAGANGLADPNPFLLSLGVNAAGVPGLALYSAAADAGGGLQRYWALRAAAGPDGRTEIDGRLIWSDPGQDDLLNLLDDAETDLQPCETGSTVGLPRALAPGSTVSGWVDDRNAELTVTATTVDGQRSVTATVSASRVP